MKIKPYGILYTQLGREYYLLAPAPRPKDSWMTDRQTAWYVVERITNDWDNHYPASTSCTLITIDPDIELRWDMDEIEIDILLDQAEAEPEPAPEELFLAPVDMDDFDPLF